MLLVGIILYHSAVIELKPHLAELPDNMAKGFYDVFKFAALEADSQDTKVQAITALAKCGVLPVMCSSSYPVTSMTSSTVAEKAKILANFNNSLMSVMKICNDKYFGTDALAGVGADLNKMLADVAAVDATNAPCVGTNALYCSMYASSDSVKQSVAGVNAEIDKFTTGKMVTEWKDNASKLDLLHILPYILVISALFFLCFWYRDGACWCCCFCKDGSKMGCLYILPHAFFWLLFFITNSIIFGVGLVIMIAADDIKVDSFKGKPSVKDLLDHIETQYPEFWDLVLGGVTKGLGALWKAAVVFEVFSIVIVAYGCCMCCCRPYREDKTKVVAM